MNTPAQIRRATAIAHRAVESLDAEVAQALIDLYQAQAEDIAGRIRRHAGPDDNLSLQELRSLLGQVEGILQHLSSERDALLGEALTQAADYGTRPALGMVQPNGAVVATAASMQTSEDALRFVRNFVAADGLQLSDRIWRLDRGARDAVVNAIESAVIQGHGAAQAAREFLARGDKVPVDIQDRMALSGAGRIAKGVTDQLLTGNGSAMDNAMRLMRTEINRAHGEAYMMSGANHPDFAGWRFLLSPAHPEPDICDLLSTQNLHGLGPGVYPTREKTPWPAHPNTLSFLEIVFKDEITDADRAGKETPTEALARLSKAQQVGVLGKNKYEVFKAGQLKQGMIRAPWRVVQKRIGAIPPPKPPSKPHTKPVKGIDDMLRLGRIKGDELLAKAAVLGNVAEKLPDVLRQDLSAVRPIGTAARVSSNGKGAELVRAASRLFPDAWTKAADAFGDLEAKAGALRGFYRSIGTTGVINASRFTTAVHEYAHRLQHTINGLDDLFQELHHRRTSGDPIKSLRSLTGIGYARNEVTREDKYINPYQGKIYSGSNRYLGKYGAMEVMTMGFESVLGGSPAVLDRLLKLDREMFDLVIGALYHYVP